MARQFFQKDLTGDGFLMQLQADLDGCKILRFLVAYISPPGIEAIGSNRLAKALKHRKSFGVTSLSCQINHEGILNLQEECGEPTKLKIFLDLKDNEKDEPKISLLHSKLIYILKRKKRLEPQKAIIYIGSHNWTKMALSVNTKKNAEVSIRIETSFKEGDLEGNNTSLGSEVNKHLLTAWELKSSLGATILNKPIFDDFRFVLCERQNKKIPKLTELLVLIACGTDDIPNINNSANQSIYLQSRDGFEGKSIYNNSTLPVLLLFYRTISDLQNGFLPCALLCRITTNIQTQAGNGDNQASNSIEGFSFVMRDTIPRTPNQNSIELQSGLTVSYWPIATVPQNQSNSAAYDESEQPLYQFQIRIEQVLVSEGNMAEQEQQNVWNVGEMAFTSNPQIKVKRIEGIAVGSNDLAKTIMNEQKEVFGISKPICKLVEKNDNPQEGFRIASSVLNHLVITKGMFSKLNNEGKSIYDIAKEKGIFTIPELEYPKSKMKELIKRTTVIFHEPHSWLKKWVASFNVEN